MALTQKQQRALASAPKAKRAALRAAFQKQDNGNGGKPGNGRKAATRSMGEIVLAPGVGRVPRSPFGGLPGSNLRCWNAMDPTHAALPRSVGPYAVVRTTKIFENSERVNVFGTAVTSEGHWSTTVCWSGLGLSTSVNAALNTEITNVNPPGVLSGSSSTFSCVPAALTVQVMNPNPLQSTEGLVYAAVCPTQLALIDNTRTYQQFIDEFTSFMKPRLLSAPKLALRGIHMDSYPLNMSALANFEKIDSFANGSVAWSSSPAGAGSQYLTGLAPMVVCNTSGTKLTYSVTIEWRVRFDIANPAVASHQHHGVTPDAKWDSMIRSAVALGNGVKDIADVVATAGQAVGGLRGAMRMLALE